MSQELILPHPLEPLRHLVLHAVSSPLTPTMYGHAMDEYFAWWKAVRRLSGLPCRSTGGARPGAGLDQPAALGPAQAHVCARP